MRAIAHIDTFRSGTNLEAWLFTILRNNFNSEYRKWKRTEQDTDDRYAAALMVPADQIGWGIAHDLRTALGKLSSAHRQALILVGASGLSYDEAAVLAGCEVGTMKSRVNRARRLLAAFISGDGSAARRPGADRASLRRAA